MKINNSINNINNNITEVKKNSHQIQQQNDNYKYNDIHINPMYYRAQSKINFKSNSITCSNEKRDIHLSLDEETVEKYLTDKNGNIDYKLIRTFYETYKQRLEYYQEAEEQRRKALNEIASSNKETKIIPFSEQQEIEKALIKSLNSDDLMEAIIENSKSDRVKRELAGQFLVLEDHIKNIKYNDAYNETVKFFEMSKKENSYDFSSQEEKFELISKIDLLCWNTGKDENFSRRIIDCSTKNGKCDFEYAKLLTQLLTASDIASPNVEYTARLMDKFIEKDPENKDIIISSMIEFAHICPIDELNDNFENYFNNCYNTESESFEPKRFELLKNIIKETEKEFDFSKNLFNDYYIDFMEWENKVIKKYFELNTNKFTGSIINKPLDICDFVARCKN